VKRYAIRIKPLSDFATRLAGDTLFGHFCWQVAYDAALVAGGLEAALARYDERPFAVFSSGFPEIPSTATGGRAYALPRPALPMSWLCPVEEDRRQRIEHRKEHKRRSWVLLSEDLRLDLAGARYCTGDEVAVMVAGQTVVPHALQPTLEKTVERPHNTINRATNTTGTGMFAPYSVPSLSYLPGMRLVVFAILDADATDIDRIVLGLSRIGSFGFGRDASTGMGRFVVEGARELSTPASEAINALYTLGPCVPKKSDCGGDYFFTPFVRYGRHGDTLATSPVPYKAPVVMAGPGAVFTLLPGQPVPAYVGRAVRGVSRMQPEAVHQGYAPCLPTRLEVPA